MCIYVNVGLILHQNLSDDRVSVKLGVTEGVMSCLWSNLSIIYYALRFNALSTIPTV